MNKETQNDSKTVLVAEDEKDVREALTAALTRAGFGVIPTVDGEETLLVALQEKPDLILLDLIMPKKDGLDVLKELRADEWGKDVKVIILTAVSDIEKVAKAVEVGGEGLQYLVKTDWKLEDVVERVKKELGE